MESQTEASPDDVGEGELPDWLVGVIVVIVILVMAVIILIITTFIKNRSKSRSNVFSTATVCDDLESGKLGHNLDSTMMTSLTSIPNSIHDSALPSHSVTATTEYVQQIPSPTSADVIYGGLGCRNPLFVDDDDAAPPDDTNYEDRETLARRDQANCFHHDSTSASNDVPATSRGYLKYDATSKHRSAKYELARKTLTAEGRNTQTDQAGQLLDSQSEMKEIDGVETTYQYNSETNQAGSTNDQIGSLENTKSDYFKEIMDDRHNAVLSMVDRKDMVDGNIPGHCTHQHQPPGSGHGWFSLAAGSSGDVCHAEDVGHAEDVCHAEDVGHAEDDLVTNLSQSGSQLMPGRAPRHEPEVLSSQHLHVVKDVPPATVNPRGCTDDGEGGDLPGQTATSQDPQRSSLVSSSDPHQKDASMVCVGTNSRQQDTANSSTTQTIITNSCTTTQTNTANNSTTPAHTTNSSTTPADGLDAHNPSSGCAQDTAASASESVEATSTFTSCAPTSPVAMTTPDMPTSPDTMPTPALAESTPHVAVSVPAVPTSAEITPTSPEIMPKSVFADPTPEVTVSTLAVAVPTQIVTVPTLTWTTPTSPNLSSTQETEATLDSTQEIEATVGSTQEIEATVGSTQEIEAKVGSTQEIEATVGSTREMEATVEQEAVQCERSKVNHNVDNYTDVGGVNQQPPRDASPASLSPTTGGTVSRQDRTLDASNNNDVVGSDDVNLQTPTLSPTTGGTVSSQDRTLDASNSKDVVGSDDVNLQTPTLSPTTGGTVSHQDRTLDASNSKDVVGSDHVNLQTPTLTRPRSDTDGVSQQTEIYADVFNVHL